LHSTIQPSPSISNALVAPVVYWRVSTRLTNMNNPSMDTLSSMISKQAGGLRWCSNADGGDASPVPLLLC
jgi:hypothetical protein